jgi:hypothetical protein
VGAAAAIASGVALVVDASARAWLTLAAVALAETAIAMVLVGVRQWRFAPRVRQSQAAALLVAGVGTLFAAPALAVGGAAWPIAVVVAGLGVAVGVGLPIARRVACAASSSPGTRVEDRSHAPAAAGAGRAP